MLTLLLATALPNGGVTPEPVPDLIAKLRRRYPAFKAVDVDDIAYWIDDARRIVTSAWGPDEEPGLLSLAAHNMALGGVLAATGGTQLPAGVTRFRSGSVDISLSDAAASQAAEGGYQATQYGREFVVMLRRNAGGPYLVGTCDAW